MKVLVVIAHCDPGCTTSSHKIAKATEEALLEQGNEVKVVDLVKCGFDKTASAGDLIKVQNPERFSYLKECGNNENLIPLIREHQDLVRWCTHLIVVGPMWFFTYPATFHAWFERVFTMGFAFGPKGPDGKDFGGIIEGKTALLVMTTGDNAEAYSPEGPLTSLECILYPISFGHFAYCGFRVLRSQGFFAPTLANDEELAKWKLAVKNLEHRPELVFSTKPKHEGEPNNGALMAAIPCYTLDEAIAAK